VSLSGFKRPTLDDITTRVIADVNAGLPEIDANLRYSVVGVLSKVLAGAMHSLYGYLDWIADQTNLLYCSDENLDGWGLVWGIARKGATKASGTVTLTGTNTSLVPAGTVLQTLDSRQYTVTADVAVASGTATAAVEAEDYGFGWNQTAGVHANLLNPVAGINRVGTVVGITGGSDIESDADYRARILRRIAEPPQGGSKGDYIAWATAVPGVTRAWCNPLENGAGTVVVRFMMDDAYEDGVPQAGDITTVQAYIDVRRPITADVSVVAPATQNLNITVLDMTPDTTQIRASVRAEIADMIVRQSEPGGIIYLSEIWEAVAQATGVANFKISAPTDDITLPVGTIAVPGTVTFSESP
jgi:uncharacterized phage protein gp47/JayE